MDGLLMQSQSFYAPEIRREVTVRGTSAAGVLRVHAVQRIPDDKARQLATVLETIRDGLVSPQWETNSQLLEAAEKYPDLVARLFIAIRKLTPNQ